jgi:hypothetical protein
MILLHGGQADPQAATGLAPSIFAVKRNVLGAPVNRGMVNPGMPDEATRTAFRVGRFFRGLGMFSPHGQ